MSSTRFLYVPAGVSKDSQVDRAHRLIRDGYAERVEVHDHAILAPCAGPNGAIDCITVLTGPDGTGTVEPVSKSTTTQ